MDARQMKIMAAAEALRHVENGMRLGIGTGSTAEEFVRLLAEKVSEGFEVSGSAQLIVDPSASTEDTIGVFGVRARLLY